MSVQLITTSFEIDTIHSTTKKIQVKLDSNLSFKIYFIVQLMNYNFNIDFDLFRLLLLPTKL